MLSPTKSAAHARRTRRCRASPATIRIRPGETIQMHTIDRIETPQQIQKPDLIAAVERHTYTQHPGPGPATEVAAKRHERKNAGSPPPGKNL